MFLFTSIVLYAIALQFAYALPVMKRIVINPSHHDAQREYRLEYGQYPTCDMVR